jgi:hypothetical protein
VAVVLTAHGVCAARAATDTNDGNGRASEAHYDIRAQDETKQALDKRRNRVVGLRSQ